MKPGMDRGASNNPSNIFVVDDEQVIASTLKLILEINGYRAQCFSSPLKALQAARSHTPDILLSDVVMPEISGIDLAIAMTDLFPQCQVLLFSGQALTSDLLRAANAKGYSFRLLSKPVRPEHMIAEIGKIARAPARTMAPARHNPESHEPRLTA